jgi:hypothetical protein
MSPGAVADAGRSVLAEDDRGVERGLSLAGVDVAGDQVLARLGRSAPVAVRLALRDLARYQARSRGIRVVADAAAKFLSYG